MKPASYLIAVSLLANGALVGFLLLRTPAHRTQASALASHGENSAAAADQARASALLAALASGDAKALAAAGCPPETIRALSVGRAFDAYEAQLRSVGPLRIADSQYWRLPPRIVDPNVQRERWLVLNKALRDLNEAIRLAYGILLHPEPLLPYRESPYAFLPPAKREQLIRIEQDYAGLEAELFSGNRFQLAADREKLALLRRERESDISAALTPEEREQLDLRSSSTAHHVRELYGEALQSEEAYKKIYALQKAYDERFSTPEARNRALQNPEMMDQAIEAEHRLYKDIRAALSSEQLATLQRNNDEDRTTAAAVAHRLNLPSTAVDAVLATRDLYASQSLQINANTALTTQERRTQIQALLAQSQADLQATLGPDGAQAYMQDSPWIRMLRTGTAFSTNLKDAPSAESALLSAIFQVRPPAETSAPAK